MVKTKNTVQQAYAAIDEVLGQIIDDWYERVAGHYLTQDKLEGQPHSSTAEPELKYFHDKAGHRIKFNRDDLDFTYGLRSYCDDAHCVIEISVNNKVKINSSLSIETSFDRGVGCWFHVRGRGKNGSV